VGASAEPFDAVVVVSFGGPERREDVVPFLENVLRGRNVPRSRLEEVAEHYYQFEGRSPIGAATRAMIAALQSELEAHGPAWRVYGGNRNWHPFLEDTLRQMADDGVRRALALVTSAFGSYSGCRQYLDDIEGARRAVGERAPVVEKLRLFYNHPEFIAIMAERVAAGEGELIFTAHSIPTAMAATGPYQQQLAEACASVAAAAGRDHWRLAFQSRSGPPQQPWLEPSLETVLTAARADGAEAVTVVPMGFLADHMEVVFDLDLEARQRCAALGLRMTRVQTAGAHPRFPGLVRELILERTASAPRRALGPSPPWPDRCPAGCCQPSGAAGIVRPA
jgi:ferrochelatase